MIFALLIILVGAVVLAGWVHLLATRAVFAEQATDGQKRRLARENGRQLAVQYILERMPSGDIPTTSSVLADGWGGFAITGPANSVLTSMAAPVSVNPFSPGERWGYSADIGANISDGETDYGWLFRVRSRSPLFSGYALTSQQPASTVSSLVTVLDTSLLWSTSAAYDYDAAWYQAPATRAALHSRGAALVGFPYVPLTSGSVPGYDSYAGYMDVDPVSGGLNDVTDDPGTAEDGITVSEVGSERTITLDLTKINISSFPSASNALIRYQVDGAAGTGLTSVKIRLQGATDSGLPPLLVIYEPATLDLTDVTLLSNNSRRVYLSVTKNTAAALSLTTLSSAAWRLSATIQNTGIVFATAGGLQISGGLRHNGNISVSAGSVTIGEDSSPGGLEFMADRIGWLESYKP